MIHGIYKKDGPDERLRSQGALLREDENDSTIFLAQFDGLWLPESHHWHPFPKEIFEVDE